MFKDKFVIKISKPAVCIFEANEPVLTFYQNRLVAPQKFTISIIKRLIRELYTQKRPCLYFQYQVTELNFSEKSTYWSQKSTIAIHYDEFRDPDTRNHSRMYFIDMQKFDFSQKSTCWLWFCMAIIIVRILKDSPEGISNTIRRTWICHKTRPAGPFWEARMGELFLGIVRWVGVRAIKYGYNKNSSWSYLTFKSDI